MNSLQGTRMSDGHLHDLAATVSGFVTESIWQGIMRNWGMAQGRRKGVQRAHLTQRMAVFAGCRMPMVQMQPIATYLRQ